MLFEDIDFGLSLSGQVVCSLGEVEYDIYGDNVTSSEYLVQQGVTLVSGGLYDYRATQYDGSQSWES